MRRMVFSAELRFAVGHKNDSTLILISARSSSGVPQRMQELTEGQSLMPKVARHCFISRLVSLSASLSIRLSHLAPLCLLCTVFFLRCSPCLTPRVHLRSPDTNGQSKLRHYEVPGAEVTPLWSHPPFWWLPPPSTGEKLPLDFHREKGTPYPCNRTHQPAQRRAPGTYFAEPTRARY